MFRATKGSGVTITTILRNNAIETRPGNKIHHLREKRSACVHCAPDWKTTIGEDVTSRSLDRVQGATKINTSETLDLQRYIEIVPSVNRTAVITDTKTSNNLNRDKSSAVCATVPVESATLGATIGLLFHHRLASSTLTRLRLRPTRCISWRGWCKWTPVEPEGTCPGYKSSKLDGSEDPWTTGARDEHTAIGGGSLA